MRYRTSLTLAIAALVLGGFVRSSPAQYGPQMIGVAPAGAAITSSGTVQVDRPPASLRMYVELTATGDSLEAAVAALEVRVSAVKKKLEELKADGKSIVVSEPAQSETASDQQEQMAQMIRQRLGDRPVPEGLKAPEIVTAVATLKAEWPLQAEGSTPVAIVASRIRRSVEFAELGKIGAEAAETPSPEVAEVIEEMQILTAEESGAQQPGQPVFVYAAPISAEDRQKAMAEAFQKAKAEAAELARAAGVAVGPLVGLSGGAQAGADESYAALYSSDYEQHEYIQRIVQRVSRDAPDDKSELTAGAPDALRLSVSVVAQFGIAPPSPQ